jgi:hypothetical protein
VLTELNQLHHTPHPQKKSVRLNCIKPTPTKEIRSTQLHHIHTHKRNPLRDLRFVHDIISRPEKEGKKRKRNPNSWNGARKQFTADGVACAPWRHMYAYAWGWESVGLVSFKAKALCLFLRRFCRPIVLLVIIRCSI